MQEIEKLKVLQSEREALKLRTKGKETEKKAENHTETVCPECGGRQLVHDYERAELVCQGCGLVIDDDFIDRGPEWRAFDHDQRMKRSRVGKDQLQWGRVLLNAEIPRCVDPLRVVNVASMGPRSFERGNSSTARSSASRVPRFNGAAFF